MASIAGGTIRNANLLRNNCRREIRTLEKQIARHEKWIADPFSKIQNYDNLDPGERAGLIRGWKTDIQRQQELVEILQSILKERKNK